MNKLFRKLQKPITEPGKGSYWTVDTAAGEGNKRERKRNKRTGKAQQAQQEAAASIPGASSSQAAEHSSSEEESETQPVRMPQDQSQPPAPYVGTPVYEEPTIDPALLDQGHLAGQGRMPPPRSPRPGPAPYVCPAFPFVPATAVQNQRIAAPGQFSTRPEQPVTYGQPAFGQGPPGFDAWEASFMAGPPMWAPAPPSFDFPGAGDPVNMSDPAMRGRPVRSMTTVSAPAQMMGIAGTSSAHSAPPSSVYHRGAVAGSVEAGGSSSSSTSEAGSVHSVAGPGVPQVYRRDSGSSSSSSS